jgi:hypothetical protein
MAKLNKARLTAIMAVTEFSLAVAMPPASVFRHHAIIDTRQMQVRIPIQY